MSQELNQTLRIYCDEHKTDFNAPRDAKIVCPEGPHGLSQNFPHSEYWEYCCDCQRYWLAGINKGERAALQCPNCDRTTTRRFLCATCKMISIESDEEVRFKKISLRGEGFVEPQCPGCQLPVLASVRKHDCTEWGVPFKTPCAKCPFCLESIGSASQLAPPPKISAAAASKPNPVTAAASAFPPGAKMFCASCGVENRFDDNFCKRCGKPTYWSKPDWANQVNLNVTSPPATAAAPSGTAGYAIPSDEALVPCPKCGLGNRHFARFCKRCGAPVDKTDPAPTNSIPTRNVTPAREASTEPFIGTPAPKNVVAPPPPPTTPRAEEDPWGFPPLGEDPSDRIDFKKSPRRTLLYLGGAAGVILIVVLIVINAVLSSSKADLANANTKSGNPSTPAPPANMVYVPGGDFMMGRNRADGGDEYESPAHPVTVKPFFMDTFEVTNEEYAKFVTSGHRAPPGWSNKTFPSSAARKPVTGVDWDDATAYAAWVHKRLPTEEEWEFAARGTDGRRYPWGKDWQVGAANCDSSSKGGVVDVGSFPDGKSPFGIYDMIGNAGEWTDSQLKAYAKGELPKDAVTGGKQIIRGGAWSDKRTTATSSFRGYGFARGRIYETTGFRCARDIN